MMKPMKENVSMTQEMKAVFFGNMVERYKQISKAINSQLEELKSYVTPPITRNNDYIHEEDALFYSSKRKIKETDVNEPAITNLVKNSCSLTKDPDLTFTIITNYLEDCFERITCSEERKDKIYNAIEEGYHIANEKLHNERILNFDYASIDLNEEGYIKASAESSDVGRYLYAAPIAGTDYKAVLITSFNLADNTPTLDLQILNSNNEPVLSEEYDSIRSFNRRDMSPIDLRRELDVIAKAKVNEMEAHFDLE